MSAGIVAKVGVSGTSSPSRARIRSGCWRALRSATAWLISVELRGHGHTYEQVAAILNEQGYIPLKGTKFTMHGIVALMRNCDETKQLTPRRYIEVLLEKMERAHHKTEPEAPFSRPGFPKLAKLLTEAGYLTPKGHNHWWPAQVQQLLDGRFDQHYRR